ncbi:c-type cytochrome [Sulfurimonas sp.]|uniref:c-type cytochrome n=1 Tax=Sulfurimonas sp. TaxID=2022749 RepID=UPI0025D87A99|nr:c-type cytochrome [Sulfurimonas sp.]MDD5157672.1 c-type cytochrome [Sulfurimonas sp.]
MIKLNNKLIVLGASVVASTVLFTNCFAATTSADKSKVNPAAAGVYSPIKNALDGGVTYKRANGTYAAYRYNTQATKGVNFGRTPTAAELKAWDTDIMPDGTGLPEGAGTPSDGEALYDKDCAVCHGEFGAGGKGYPTLTGGSVASLKNQRTCPGKDAPNRTIGSYWPQVSTLIWYIRDAMPYAHPKSYSPDQMYAVTAYLLAQSEIKIDGKKMDDDFVLDKKSIMKIVMPNRNGFYPNIDGAKGVENVRAFFKNPKNFGAVGTRCMKNCPKESVAKIVNEITAVVPAYSVVRDLPKEDASKGGAVSEGQKLYDASCAVCHKTDAMGAPPVGDKNAWAKVTAKGMDKVNHNAINGVGGMPPKGGAMDLTDAQMSEIVNYMVESSK